MEMDENLKNENPKIEPVEQKQEIKISKEKLNEIKQNILYSYLISFIILFLNSFFLNLDVSVEHSSDSNPYTYYGNEYSYWANIKDNYDGFKGLFKFGNDVYENSWIFKIIDPNTSYGNFFNQNFLTRIIFGNIPFIILGNFFLLTVLAIIIYFLRSEFIKFRSKYTVKIE